MSDPVGQIVGGKYRVVRRLGGGGLADVYEAVHEHIGQRFALKVLRPEYAKYADLRERFLTEGRAASRIGHPGVVQIFDIGLLADGAPYLLMELLDGEDLATILERRGKLSAAEAVGVCLHVLDGLGAAHAKGVIHRDLKPENVFLVRGPDGHPWAKIIDFGIAQLAADGPAAARLTAQGVIMGTAQYMSPEQARNNADLDGRTDLYSVGAILYEMLTGEMPFDGLTITEVLTKVLAGPLPKPRSLEPSIPQALEQVVLTAMAKRREDRYATAAEFMEALRPLRGKPVDLEIITEDDAPKPAEITSLRRIRDLIASPPPPSTRRVSSDGDRLPDSGPAVSSRSAPPLPPRLSLTPFGLDVPSPSAPPPPPPQAAPTQALPTPSPPPGTVAVRPRHLMFFVVAAMIVAALAAGAVVMITLRPEFEESATPMFGRFPRAARESPPPPAAPAADPGRLPAAAGADQGAGAGQSATAAAVEPDAGAAPATAKVTLAGLPPGGRPTVDDVPVETEFVMPVGDAPHVLRVTAPGWKPFVGEFHVRGDLVIELLMSEAGTERPAHRDGSRNAPGAGEGTEPGFVANPFEQ